MNETIRTILERRSIRKYLPKEIEETKIMQVLECARFAPSGMNRQPWHFSVVVNPSILKEINLCCQRYLEREESITYDAPCMIICSSNPSSINPEVDAAICATNIMMAAKSLGLGSCWINSVKVVLNDIVNKELTKKIGIPAGNIVCNAVVLGYPAENPQPHERVDNNFNIVK